MIDKYQKYVDYLLENGYRVDLGELITIKKNNELKLLYMDFTSMCCQDKQKFLNEIDDLMNYKHLNYSHVEKYAASLYYYKIKDTFDK